MARKKTSAGTIDATVNRSPFRPSKRAIALEPRLMFDGAVAANADQVLNPSDASHDPVIVDKTAVSVDKPSTAEDLQLPLFTADFFADKTPLEIVFVDTSVPNWQQLAGAIKPGIEIILLDPSQDGIRQIADALGTRTGVTAVHLISQGDNGELRIEEITASVSDLSSTVQTDNLLHINEVITSGENPAQAAIDLAMNSAQEAIRSFLSDKSAADLFTFFNGQ
ncbi:MAG: hypothetical protein CVU66_02220 [Deltaproteobacteria bacterium HGW-Deltaproteobacteria-23]|nr:MAG: hypothetical protein CVU66_02220 [Deltaproteobacteria bacterium HGW-Deltaproteobacteria-23]